MTTTFRDERRRDGATGRLLPRADGLTARQAQDRITRTARLALENRKLAVGCRDCGWRRWPEGLDFDHVRGTKLFTIMSSLQRNWQSIEAEIAKCEVVCSNCHRHRTKLRKRS